MKKSVLSDEELDNAINGNKIGVLSEVKSKLPGYINLMSHDGEFRKLCVTENGLTMQNLTRNQVVIGKTTKKVRKKEGKKR